VTVRHVRGFPARSGADYRHSPHLTQWPLYEHLTGFVLESLSRLPATGPSPRVLELGAGHGGYTELLLAEGCRVTAVDMSRQAVERLQARLAGNDRLDAVHDRHLDLAHLEGLYDLCLCVSVLHHVSDYLAALERMTGRLAPGGTLVTIQDPLWYPRVGRPTRVFDRSAYLAWRIGQGQVRQGVEAMIRRLRRVYPQDSDDVIAYHHVVRQGVDEEAVAELLDGGFEQVEVVSYWSHHLALSARAAGAADAVNTFAVRAAGRRATA
jgi:SAM-dependent methyltransferase